MGFPEIFHEKVPLIVFENWLLEYVWALSNLFNIFSIQYLISIIRSLLIINRQTFSNKWSQLLILKWYFHSFLSIEILVMLSISWLFIYPFRMKIIFLWQPLFTKTPIKALKRSLYIPNMEVFHQGWHFLKWSFVFYIKISLVNFLTIWR